MTAVSNEEIPFENMRAKTKTLRESKIEDIQKNLQSADKKTIVAGYRQHNSNFVKMHFCRMEDMLKKRQEERRLLKAKGLLPDEPQLPAKDPTDASTSTK